MKELLARIFLLFRSHPLLSLRMVLRRLNSYVKFDYRFLNGRSFFPETAILCPTMRCNFRCEHCYARREPANSPSKSRELTLAEWRKVIDQVSPLVQVISIGGGEPLLRPDIFQMIEYAKWKRRICGMVTNGTLLNESCADKLIECKLDFLSISLDEFHLANMHSRSLAETPSARAIMRMLEARKRRGSILPRINVSCSVVPGRLEVPESVLTLFQELQWDKLSYGPIHFYPKSWEQKQVDFKSQHIHTGDYMFGMAIPDENPFRPQDVEEMIAFLQRVKTIKNVSVMNGAAPEFYRRFFTDEPLDAPYCSVLYDTMYVDGYGNFSICQTYVLGNVRNESPSAIWNGDQAVQFRRLRKRTPHPMCFRCS
ncbi:MAG: radical SAM protein [Verrucomicrobia bacterium]|nr:radical SAM protein [Verrucomicrobiota bacterium]